MNSAHRLRPRLAPLLLVALAAAPGCDDRSTAAPKPTPPASSTHAVKEADLNVLTLTPEAERRLDVKTSPAERKRVSRARLFGGEVVVPPGKSVVVSAPLAGTVTAPEGKPAPLAGQPVEKGQPLYTLEPLLTSEARTTLTTALVDAEGQLRTADVQLKAAEITLTRAKRLASEGAGTTRAVDEAHAQYEVAGQAVEAARARREVLEAATKEGGGGSVGPLTLSSPESGVLRNVHAAPGQMVSAGAPVFEVVNPAQLWVRVAVYAGDVAEIDADRPAKVGPLGSSRGGPETPREAKPVAAPPSADARISTVDLFYELDNEKGELNPGQRVGVTVPLRGEEDSLVVPWSAIVYDANGGAWVYEKLRDRAYARRRVSVRHVTDGVAVLDGGPTPGTSVVTQGVAEMFGNEMGFAK